MQTKLIGLGFVLGLMLFPVTSAQAFLINWTDWAATDTSEGFTAFGTLTTPTSTVDVTYHNRAGIGFSQVNGGGTDYWQNNRSGRNPATSPYTSSFVDNIPTGTDILALRFAGVQSLEFSEAIANPVFAYVSLNGNGYAFDRDFDILSYGHSENGNDCGYWGCGTSFKEVVEVSPGVIEYRLLGTGEPHGVLKFAGAFDQVSWRSLTNEFWNGFTVGVQGTAEEVFPPSSPDSPVIPEPATMFLLGSGMIGAVLNRRRRG